MRKRLMRVWINDVHKREMFFLNLSSDDEWFRFWTQSETKLSFSSQDWTSELVQSFHPFSLFSAAGERGWESSVQHTIPVRLSDCAVGGWYNRERMRRRGKSTVHETQSRAIFHRRAQRERESEQAGSLSYMKEKGTFFFIRSIINRCHWSCPLCLSHSMRHWSEATKKNLLIRSWRREPKKKFRFYISPLQPTNQPTNTMFFVLTLG